MIRRTLLLCSVLVALGGLGTSVANAAVGPLFDIKATWGDTNLGGVDEQGNEHQGQFFLQARNIGDASPDASSSGDVTVTNHFPPGVKIADVEWPALGTDLSFLCSGVGTETLTCNIPGLFSGSLPLASLLLPAPGRGQESPTFSIMPNGYMPPIFIDVTVDPGASGVETNTATISGGGSPGPASDVDRVPLSETPSTFGLVPGSFQADVFSAAYPFGSPSRQAGAHPFEQRVNFDITEKTGVDNGSGGDGHRFTGPTGLVKDFEATLPRGMVGNPEATPKCDAVAFATLGASQNSTACPSDTQVGYLDIWFADGTHAHGQGLFTTQGGGDLTRVPIYNIDPPRGVVADFGFNAGGAVLGHIYPQLDPAQNYAIKTLTPNVSSLVGVRGARVTFWGVPGDPSHDLFRYYPEMQSNGDVIGAPFGGAAIRPLLTNPMDCGFPNGGARVRLDSYGHPGEFTPTQEYGNPLDVEGCGDVRFRFNPQIALQPTDPHAGAPTGLSVHLEVPQRNDEASNATELYADDSAKGIATPPIKRAIVRFPEGTTLNPSAAQGLGSCSLAQIGISADGVPNDNPVACPDDSQYGTLTIHTPILPQGNPPKGFIYIAKQGENPNGNNFLSLYLVIEEPERGILVKIPGKVDLNQATGQITTTFDNLPQFPVSDMEMNLKGGVRAGLVNPSTCGKKTIKAEFFSWQEPETAQVVDSSFDITQKPDGSPCLASLAERPFKPSMEAGMVNNTGGSYSPFVFRLARTDEDQELSRVDAILPPGLAAKFAGVASCSDAAIAHAEQLTAAGDGAIEQDHPSCPVASQIGTTNVGAGVGVPLTFVSGKIYLGGPYRGAPLSMVVISPAVVGPFDLGVITVRTALEIDPVTAQGTAASDALPQVFQGIPVRIRDVRLNLNRPDFTLNPTSCAEKQVTAHVTGAGGDVFSPLDDTRADLSNRFQAADCARLGFRPTLAFRLFGGTHRGSHPGLKAVVTYPKKGAYANIRTASVALPHSEFLDQAHIRTVCTRVQFAAKACPAGSVYGHVVAKTPLFDQPLSGPVYLRSSSHQLPDLVAVLRGPASQPVEIDLDGRIDSVNGGIRNTFDLVPDAPVSRFTLTMSGGSKGLLENSSDLCRGANRVVAKFGAQNGRRITLRPRLRTRSCGSR